MVPPKISVIVPVFNVENYLAHCLDSIINQTFQDIEIIVINDGSTDRSLEIINTYEKLDKRVKAFSHVNRGLGPTRNRGIEIAKGEYLIFIDSDDFIFSNGQQNSFVVQKPMQANPKKTSRYNFVNFL